MRHYWHRDRLDSKIENQLNLVFFKFDIQIKTIKNQKVWHGYILTPWEDPDITHIVEAKKQNLLYLLYEYVYRDVLDTYIL